MKPAEARRLASERSAAELELAIEALGEEREPPFAVDGVDEGEKLTNVLLAQRIRSRVDSGEDPKDAFRSVMAEVRAVVSND